MMIEKNAGMKETKQMDGNYCAVDCVIPFRIGDALIFSNPIIGVVDNDEFVANIKIDDEKVYTIDSTISFKLTEKGFNRLYEYLKNTIRGEIIEEILGKKEDSEHDWFPCFSDNPERTSSKIDD